MTLAWLTATTYSLQGCLGAAQRYDSALLGKMLDDHIGVGRSNEYLVVAQVAGERLPAYTVQLTENVI